MPSWSRSSSASARTRHLVARPAGSLTYFEGNDLAVIAHGQAAIVDAADPAFDELDALQVAAGMESPRGWSGDAVFLRLEPERVFTYASEPTRYGSA